MGKLKLIPVNFTNKLVLTKFACGKNKNEIMKIASFLLN